MAPAKGKLTLTHTRPDIIKVVIDKLKKAGANISIKNDIINIDNEYLLVKTIGISSGRTGIQKPVRLLLYGLHDAHNVLS